jgi:hypothetical protein
MYSTNGVYWHTGRVTLRPRFTTVAQRLYAPTQHSAEVVGLGVVEGQGHWLASPACFAFGIQMLFLLAG